MTRSLPDAPPSEPFERRLTRRVEDLTRRLSPKRRERLRWTERLHLVRLIVGQKLRREEAGDLSTRRRLDPRHFDSHSPLHPALLDLVRLLARQAAQTDVAAQHSHSHEGDPA